MSKPTTHVLLVTDMSGSMAGLAEDVRGGFNQYVADLGKDDSRYRLTVCLFDTEFIPLATAAKLKDVPKLTAANYAPRGMTALLDAVGKTITEFEARVPELADGDRVLLVVQTDGHENSSREFTRDRIAEMVKSREAAGKWSCIFLGAGIDAWAQANGMGFARANTVSTEASSRGTGSTYTAMAEVTRSYAGGGTSAEVSGLAQKAAAKAAEKED